MPLRPALLAIPLLLAGCAAASVPWQNPSVPKDQWGQDWNGCKRWAESQVGFREGDEGSPFRDHDRAQAKRQVDGYAALCMRDRGYVPVKKK